MAEKKDASATSEDVVVSKVGRDLYNKFFRGYTRKQWALDPSELDASVTARVPTRTNRDDRYFTDTFQAMPLHGYTRMFEKMLDHPNIKVMLNTDYREVVDLLPWQHMIYTGPIDAFFDYRYGKLPYRSLRVPARDAAAGAVPAGRHGQLSRTTTPTPASASSSTSPGSSTPATSVVYEYPRADGDPYYPVPRAENAALYKRYEAEAEAMDERHLRRPAGDLQVLQHGPGGGPGADAVQAAAHAPPGASRDAHGLRRRESRSRHVRGSPQARPGRVPHDALVTILPDCGRTRAKR